MTRSSLLGVSFLAACGTAQGVPDASADDAASMSETRTYVLSAFDIGRTLPMEPPTAYGFDLDGTDVGSCGATEYVSPDGRTGIDDGVGLGRMTAFPETPPDTANDTLRTGAATLLIEISGIDSYVSDDAVQAHLWLALVPNASACAAHPNMPECASDRASSCSWFDGDPRDPSPPCLPLEVDASGAIASGQTFTRGRDLGLAVGAIADGRVTLVGGTYVSVAPGHPESAVPITDLHVDGVISRDGIRHGDFGGRMSMADLVTAAATLLGPGHTEDEARALILGILRPDLDPDATGECQSVSLGLGITAVSATLE